MFRIEKIGAVALAALLSGVGALGFGLAGAIAGEALPVASRRRG